MKLRLAIAAVIFAGSLAAPSQEVAARDMNYWPTPDPGNWCWSAWDYSASRSGCPEEAWGQEYPEPERCEGRSGPFFEYDANGFIVRVWCED